jgi:hypothetical protein
VLIPETDALWSYLKGRGLLRGFVLLGGSALALRVRHRLSEDLDFVWTGLRLPRRRLEALLREAESDGFRFEAQDDLGAVEEFENADMDLHDYQQDFLVNGRIKVTFFTAGAALAKVLPDRPDEPCRIASLEELFAAKALVSAARSKSRDWFDLFILMRDHGFTFGDYAAAFEKAGYSLALETGLSRLCSGRPQANDEGFEELASPAPSIEELASFFRELRAAYEIETAAAARRSASVTGRRSADDASQGSRDGGGTS